MSGLEHFIAVVLGLAFGLWLAARAGWKVTWPLPRQSKLAGPAASAASLPASSAGHAAASLSARLHSLEKSQAEVRDRIAWALDSLHNILQVKG